MGKKNIFIKYVKQENHNKGIQKGYEDIIKMLVYNFLTKEVKE